MSITKFSVSVVRSLYCKKCQCKLIASFYLFLNIQHFHECVQIFTRILVSLTFYPEDLLHHRLREDFLSTYFYCELLAYQISYWSIADSIIVTDLFFFNESKNLIIFRFIFLFQKIVVVFSVYVCYPAVNCQFPSCFFGCPLDCPAPFFFDTLSTLIPHSSASAS